MCHAKGYYAISRLDSTPVARIELEIVGKIAPRVSDFVNKVNPLSKDDPPPMLSVFKDKCLVVSQANKRVQFLQPAVNARRPADDKEQVGILKQYPVFNLDASRFLNQILLIDEEYVVAVYDTQITIFNAQTGDVLEHLGQKVVNNTKFRFKCAASNIENK